MLIKEQEKPERNEQPAWQVNIYRRRGTVKSQFQGARFSFSLFFFYSLQRWTRTTGARTYLPAPAQPRSTACVTSRSSERSNSRPRIHLGWRVLFTSGTVLVKEASGDRSIVILCEWRMRMNLLLIRVDGNTTVFLLFDLIIFFEITYLYYASFVLIYGGELYFVRGTEFVWYAFQFRLW